MWKRKFKLQYTHTHTKWKPGDGWRFRIQPRSLLLYLSKAPPPCLSHPVNSSATRTRQSSCETKSPLTPNFTLTNHHTSSQAARNQGQPGRGLVIVQLCVRQSRAPVCRSEPNAASGWTFHPFHLLYSVGRSKDLLVAPALYRCV